MSPVRKCRPQSPAHDIGLKFGDLPVSVSNEREVSLGIISEVSRQVFGIDNVCDTAGAVIGQARYSADGICNRDNPACGIMQKRLRAFIGYLSPDALIELIIIMDGESSARLEHGEQVADLVVLEPAFPLGRINH